jgi:hypothetical protein
MMPANASDVRRGDEGAVPGLVMAKWLRLAAAPSFAIMALLTVALDSSLPNAVCLAASHFGLGGMTPMYLLMAIFHSAPWLNLISRRRTVAQYSSQSCDSFHGPRSF